MLFLCSCFDKHLNTTVPNESVAKTSKVFKEHLNAKQMWTSPYKYLNSVQEEAANLAFTKSFQLIQGPPGYTHLKLYLSLTVL